MSEQKQLSELQERIGKLEKLMEDLKIKSKENLAIAKKKLLELREQNKKLIAQLKGSSIVQFSNRLYKKVSGEFKKEELPKVKKILCYDCCGDIGYMRGYVTLDTRRGFFIVEDAEFIDYVPNREPVIISFLGSAIVNADHVVMWF